MNKSLISLYIYIYIKHIFPYIGPIIPKPENPGRIRGRSLHHLGVAENDIRDVFDKLQKAARFEGLFRIEFR